jgi:hypothetical protein
MAQWVDFHARELMVLLKDHLDNFYSVALGLYQFAHNDPRPIKSHSADIQDLSCTLPALSWTLRHSGAFTLLQILISKS